MNSWDYRYTSHQTSWQLYLCPHYSLPWFRSRYGIFPPLDHCYIALTVLVPLVSKLQSSLAYLNKLPKTAKPHTTSRYLYKNSTATKEFHCNISTKLSRTAITILQYFCLSIYPITQVLFCTSLHRTLEHNMLPSVIPCSWNFLHWLTRNILHVLQHLSFFILEILSIHLLSQLFTECLLFVGLCAIFWEYNGNKTFLY